MKKNLLSERIARRLAASCVLAVSCVFAACSDEGPTASGTTSAPSGKPSAAPTKSSEVPADHVELQKLVLASAIKSKDPADDLDATKPGQRVYAHVTVRNRTAGTKRVSVSFRVNGDERTMVDLDIEKSWSWRSWAYVTLRKDDKGELTVHVFDDHGAELADKTIPIR